jgi:hypothetical protein
MLKDKLMGMNKTDFQYKFSSESNLQVIDELNRNLRTIWFSLDDFFFRENFMNHDNITEIIKKYFKFKKET